MHVGNGALNVNIAKRRATDSVHEVLDLNRSREYPEVNVVVDRGARTRREIEERVGPKHILQSR